jgi:hypothetical protein
LLVVVNLVLVVELFLPPARVPKQLVGLSRWSPVGAVQPQVVLLAFELPMFTDAIFQAQSSKLETTRNSVEHHLQAFGMMGAQVGRCLLSLEVRRKAFLDGWPSAQALGAKDLEEVSACQ